MKFKNKDDILKKQLKFNASNILAKHDENYMPPEVSEALGLEY
jgi:cytochrome c-type biogenesis protein CcmE